MTNNQEIKDLEQAKSYFISMGCSHFHIDREDFERAKEYRALKIDSAIESAWRKEEFDQQLDNYTNTNKDKLGLAFAYLADISESNDYYLERLSDLTSQILDITPNNQIRLVLLTLIGDDNSNTHGGLIQKAYKIKRKDLRDNFIHCALTFIEKANKKNIPIAFLRSNLADIIKHFKIKELFDTAIKLRQEDNYKGN